MKFKIKMLFLIVLCVICFDGYVDASSIGMLTYTFDDGRLSVYNNALPILERYGQVGVAGVYLNGVLSNWPTHMHQQELLDLESRGWEIASHSITHPHFSKIPQTYDEETLTNWSIVSGYSYTYKTAYDYNELPFVLEDSEKLKEVNSISNVELYPGSFYFDDVNHMVYVHTFGNDNPLNHEIRADSVQRELEYSKKGLNELGLHVQNFVVPFSDWNDARAKLAKEYYNCVASGGGLPNDIPVSNPYYLYRIGAGGDHTPEDVISWINQYVIDEGKWLILLFHGIGEEGGWAPWPTEYLEQVAGYVSENEINVVTLQQGIEIASVPIPASICSFFTGFIMLLVLKKKLLQLNEK